MSKQNRLPASEYDSYIKSNAWRAKRQRYFASKLPQRCLVCNDPKVHLHHRTYDRLGFEYLADLLPLCQKHHSECHDYIAKKKRSLKAGTNSYLRSKGARWHGPNGVNPSFRVARGKRKDASL